MSAEAIALERRATPWLMEALGAARTLGLDAWCIGAGAIRELAWDAFHGRRTPRPAADLDLVFFDAGRTSAAHEQALAARLHAVAPQFAWDVVNQAGPHHAFPQALARGRRAHASLEAGIATWPETATCVGIALDAHDALHIVAPLGLRDLLEGVLRYNPACGDPAVYRARVARKRFIERWPALRVAD
jgi:hypothetical protein